MVAYARRKLLGRNRKAVFHCWARCVRRAFLCGRDPLTGQDFSHRRDWILTREEQLAGLFAIEVEFHAELSNHFHLMLRSRPDVAKRLVGLRGGTPLPDHHADRQMHDGRPAGAATRRRSNRRWATRSGSRRCGAG